MADIDKARETEKRWRTAFKTFFRRFDPAVIAAVGLFLLICAVIVAVIYLT